MSDQPVFSNVKKKLGEQSRHPPLEGVRVIDLTIAMAGPLASQRLGDMGADIIKIESLDSGDLTRVFILNDTTIDADTTSFLALNRNKRSVCINLKEARGREVLLRLAKTADVLLQNFRPGVVDRLGVSYSDVQAVNDSIVYCSISGFGDTGPMAQHPGQDLLVQAFSGMMFNAGYVDGPPHPAPVYLVDAATSHLATEAILAALIQRQRDGVGQHVKVSLLGAALEMQIQELTTYLHTRKLASRTRSPYASIWLEPPYGIYRTSDSWIALSQNDMRTIGEIVGSESLIRVFEAKPIKGDSSANVAWRDELYCTLQDALLSDTTNAWIKKLLPRKIWCGPVQTYEELVDHPQSAGFFASFYRQGSKQIDTVAPAISFSQGEAVGLKPPPTLGEHTEEVLLDLGMTKEEITSLRNEKIVS
ncbi:MAG: CoA transferase [Bradyrhizobiaceae bacterium]|nr:CoA transferase [Bradyrhizobiaceae bacterium]